MNTWCVPFALAKITGQTSDQIAARIKAGEFGEHRSKYVRRVRTSLWVDALPKLGVRVTAHVRRPGMTVATWAGIRARHSDATPWLVHVRGHVLLYRAGRFYDNGTDPEGVASTDYKYRNSRVESARQVTAWSDANPFREPGVYLGPKSPWAAPPKPPRKTKPAKRRPSYEERIAHTRALMARWETKAKRAATAMRKLQRRVRALERAAKTVDTSVSSAQNPTT
jgi:hypothetical protein